VKKQPTIDTIPAEIKVPNPKRSSFWIFWSLIAVFLLSGMLVAYYLFLPNVKINTENSLSERSRSPYYLYIPSGADYAFVIAQLERDEILKDIGSFQVVARCWNYPEKVRSGRYCIRDGMSNYGLVRLLLSGMQEPVKFRFEAFRNLNDWALIAEKQLDVKAADIMALLQDKAFCDSLAIDSEQLIAFFIPNTYEVYWNISARGLIRRIKNEYDNFWNATRRQKALQQNLTPIQVSILASIVDGETYRESEKPKIAGLYLNRLKRNMLLQADPTVKFAVGDPTLKRILHQHLEIDSPYNTYKYPGLPPSPIACPSLTALEAVLNPENHDYIYMCAKADNSGYHHFTKNLTDHMRYAREYQQFQFGNK
jgi:UPF0755 protein